MPTSAAENSETANDPGRAVWRGLLTGLLLSALIVVPAEFERCRDLISPVNSEESNSPSGPVEPEDRREPGLNPFIWLFNWNIDTSPFLLLLALAPMMLRRRRDRRLNPVPNWRPNWLIGWLADSPRNDQPGATRRVAVGVAIVSAVALFACLRVAGADVRGDGSLKFGDLPPALHDEFSYLFQARTFRAGHWTYPSHPEVPRLFDQMHVLNEGRFASRYFPGTGVWIAAASTLGSLYAGHWIATMLVCVFLFLSGRELSCNGVGLLAGLLAALSPGIDLFANLLLAHQPTLAGLGLFLFGFLRMTRPGRSKPASECALPTVSAKWATLSGIGLSLAMLCRPMTAAGFATPFGILLAIWLIRHGRSHRRAAAALLAGFGVPLLAGFATLAVQNAETTGSAFESPYQRYTELFTPSHQYGFHNVERAKPLQTPRVLKHYDDWAENLDAGLATRNVKLRLIASSQWTLGIVALLISACVFCGGVFDRGAFGAGVFRAGAFRDNAFLARVFRGSLSVTGPFESLSERSAVDRRWLLIPASILSLHVAHLPYWYDGILHWHYVFESSVLWCLLAAAATLLLVRLARSQQRSLLPIWWGGVIVASLAVNQIALPPFWGLSRLRAGINEFAYPRSKQQAFRQILNATVTERPALVLVRHDPSDRHIDYVNNHPGLAANLLIGRLPADTQTADTQTSEAETVQAALSAFPDRAIFIFDVESRQIRRIPRRASEIRH